MKKILYFIALFLVSVGIVQAAVYTIGGTLYYDSNGYLGIGTSTPNRNLTIVASRPSIDLGDWSGGVGLKHWILSSYGGNFAIGTSTDTYATSSRPAFELTTYGQIIQAGQLPLLATSTGIGTTGTVTVQGAPNFMTLSITTGLAPATSATIVTITASSTCASKMIPVFSPANSNASQLGSSTRQIFATSTSQTSFLLQSGTLGLLPSTNYIWNVFVGCY